MYLPIGVFAREPVKRENISLSVKQWSYVIGLKVSAIYRQSNLIGSSAELLPFRVSLNMFISL